MQNTSNALVLLSGGQDSSTCLAQARTEYEYVHAISFYYGQRHSVELESAKEIAAIFKTPHLILDLSFVKEISQSGLLRVRDNISLFNEHPIFKSLPDSFVPLRNMLLLVAAGMYAITVGIPTLITGVCQIDYSGYPDCRGTFIDMLQETMRLACGVEHYYPVAIKTPLLNMSKADIFALADSLGVLDTIRYKTKTCYNGDHHTRNEWGYGCGLCPSCALREKGWKEFLERRNNK
jgi:7-cyano-7-deazaguanine synthase